MQASSAQPIILPFRGIYPKIAKSAFIAPGAVVIGDVEIGEESNVWFGCVIRGDVNHIRIGSRTNIQDGSIVHVTRKTHPTIIGNNITIGHQVMLHGCTVKDNAFIGMQSVMLDGSCVEEQGMLAAGALLTPGKTVPTHELWAGNPAKLMRPMKQQEIDYIAISASNYVALAREYM